MLRAMLRNRVLVAALPLLASSGVALARPAIIGGTPTTVGEYPNVVAIQVGEGLCTGTLLTENWVLTAGHCVTPAVVDEPDQASVTASIEVYFNTVDPFTNTGMMVKAMSSMPDPDFNYMALGSHDSGLIELATPVTNITPVIPNFKAANASVGITVTMVGYGDSEAGTNGGEPPQTAGTENVVMQTTMSCAPLSISDANMLCYSQTDGKGKCEGDSGGPSFAMINGHLVEVGLTSFGDPSCAQYGTDTRLDAETAFITAHVDGFYCTDDDDCTQTEHSCFKNACIVTPFQPTGLGSTCTGGSDCESGTCASGNGGEKCTTTCTMGGSDSCPASFSCIAAPGTSGICWPSSDTGGCCDASGASGKTSVIGMAVVAMMLRRRRRR
jgi:secreted trypsin-like serine protease